MASEIIAKLTALGQSLWYDNIQRRLLENGELAAMIARGDISGLTSNPAIFHNAIARSHDYDASLVPLAWAGLKAEDIFWHLAIQDIRAAAALLLPLYQTQHGDDGFVSLEVDPRLAHDTTATVVQVGHLWSRVAAPNLMVKIPATPEGLPAIRQAIAAGININVTLIFSLARYHEVMEAYLSGLEQRLAQGLPIDQIDSVASFFVSRIDTKIDGWLQSAGRGVETQRLMGQAAIASARLAYQAFRQVFEGERFTRLKAHGARLQRPLWASTSTKNPAYPATIYVDQLIGPNTVNTVPPQTLEAFRRLGQAALSLESGLEDASQVFDRLAAVGISIDRATQELETEGVKAFEQAFDALLETIEARRKEAVEALGPLVQPYQTRITRLVEAHTPRRIWEHDASLWRADGDDTEIADRLGWLTLPRDSSSLLPDLKTFAAEARAAGYDRALLLGMGGSSLAPEVISLTQRALSRPTSDRQAGFKFAILDSTDPAQVLAAARRFPARRSLYLVASKSGGTSEVNAFLDFFWARTIKAVGRDKAGEHFVAITDPGTSLEKLAGERKFRRVFLGEPTVGGRFSALSAFGLAPAALMGIDLEDLLARAAHMMALCQVDPVEEQGYDNPGLALGALLGEAALQGRDKLTLLADPATAACGSWLEQLVAESSGKNGVGIVPVDLEPLAPPAAYGRDRLFVYLRHSGSQDRVVSSLREAGHPVVTFPFSGLSDLGTEFYRWGFATAVACSVLGVVAFDQPDVQVAKTQTLKRIQAYRETGQLLDDLSGDWDDATALQAFLSQSRAGDYLAINAYLPRNPQVSAGLRRLRLALGAKTGLATTLGFGPRFLHSTGQLHKGGANNGLFLQITADPTTDVAIPGQGLTFGVLERAQSLGDLEVLQTRARRVLRLHLPDPETLSRLVEWVEVL